MQLAEVVNPMEYLLIDRRKQMCNPNLRHQTGAASLIVVALLLSIMTIVVTFANRSSVYDQKTSANQYRSTLAFEAADAGLSWAQAMMNTQTYVNNTCGTSTTAGDGRFKTRYLVIDPLTSKITLPTSYVAGSVVAACAYNQSGGTMNCSCPASGTAPTAAAPTTASGYTPGFAIAFVTNAVTGTVDLVSYGCTSVINSTTCTGDASAIVRSSLGQVSGLATPPASPLTARGNVSIGNAALGVSNPDPNTNGVTINAGGTIDAANARIATIPGTPPKSTLVGNDASLRTISEDGMFATFFGMSKAAYKSLPSTYVLPCTSCSQSDVLAAYAAGQRQIWVPGGLSINANSTIGSTTDPIVMVVDGALAINGGPQISGVIYSTSTTWDSTGGGGALLRGAAISEGNYTGNGTPDYYYDPTVMSAIRASAASFVQIPGSWRDF